MKPYRTRVDVPDVCTVVFDLIMLPLLPIWLCFRIMVSLCQHMSGKGIDKRVDPGTGSAGSDPTSALWSTDNLPLMGFHWHIYISSSSLYLCWLSTSHLDTLLC